MDTSIKVETYYEKEHAFKEAIAMLRALAVGTEMTETYKWNFPVYTIENKNIIGICRFSHHFGIWFFNGSILKDPKRVLQNAQEGKTMHMRHWKFKHINDINTKDVLGYIQEAIDNQKKGILPEKKAPKTPIKRIVPEQLKVILETQPQLNKAFAALSPYKQKEFCEYIATAKQEKTKQTRLDKIKPMILEGKGLNDRYRK